MSELTYRTMSHSNSSQVCEGTYPLDMSKEEVEGRVQGSFGGRFEYFSAGKFKYIAYTD